MSFAPFAAVWFLFVVAAGICFLAGRRPRIHMVVALTVPVIALALWSLFRPDEIPPTLEFAGRQWAVTGHSWYLTGTILILALAAAVRSVMNQQPPLAARQSALSLLLVAATLPVVWAADDRTRVMGLALFAMAMIVMALIFARESVPTGTGGKQMDWGNLAAVFSLWLASALPAGRFAFGVLAATLLVITQGYNLVQNHNEDHPARIMLMGLPVIVAGAILAATIFSSIPSAVELAAGTAIGLLGMVIGLFRIWQHSPVFPPRPVSLVLSGLALTAAIWAGQDALLAGVRLAVFVPVLLILTASLPKESLSPASRLLEDGPNGGVPSKLRMTPGLLAMLIATLVSAGLPLTVGFNTLAPLYDAWQTAGGWVLLIVVSALWSLLLAAMAVRGRTLARAGWADRDAWLRGTVLLVPTLALLSLDTAKFNAGWAAWLAIAISALASVIIGRFATSTDALGGLLREAVKFPQSATQLKDRLRQARETAAGGMAEALAILDGENGLLWVLGLLLLLLWIA